MSDATYRINVSDDTTITPWQVVKPETELSPRQIMQLAILELLTIRDGCKPQSREWHKWDKLAGSMGEALGAI